MFHSEINSSDAVFLCNHSIHKSCEDGDLQSVSSYLNSQPTLAIMEDPYQNMTPIHFAARFGKLDCLRQVASIEPNVINIQSSKTFQTPLHCAAEGGHPHCTLWLLQAGTNPEVKDILGETALHKAARVGSSECVRQLSAVSCNISSQNLNGQTASVMADMAGFPAIAVYLRRIELAGMTEFQNRGYASRPLCAVPRRKRMRDEICGDDFCKKRRTDDISVEMHNLFGAPDPITSMDSSLVEHDRLCWVEYGYKNIYMDALLSDYHGC